ncbi:MAG: phosphodiesterase [Confluentimicrobium sp.]|nr:phosphodiesterase [Actibacterium sp.]MAQ46460.1 phosphodiesterase [Actibacterium sp.]MBF54172.1 phosphodiesterase [Actibacterium sp.]|tara:strand:- start:220 stop:1104 length:885 start_codon:yes stop_codon:yes gene_type:complete
MRRILHLSDVHFGRDRPELLHPLLQQINTLAPDLVALSGDLTQRARSWQFRQARAFLDRIEPPVLVVPGNHDIPLENILQRVVRPYSGYREYISSDLAPIIEDDEIIVIGINTVNHLRWQTGRIKSREVARICERIADAGPDKTSILVAHHPFTHLDTDTKQLMRGASKAIETLANCGADMVLSGHLHSWRAEPFVSRDRGSGLLQFHAGTGLSNRLRGEQNDFNMLEITPHTVRVTRYVADEGGEDFTLGEDRFYLRKGAGWARVEEVPQDQAEAAHREQSDQRAAHAALADA